MEIYSEEEKQWATLAHGLPLLVTVLSGMGFLAAFGIYFAQKDRSKFVAFHALQAGIFQLGIVLLIVIGWLTMSLFVGFAVLGLAGLLELAIPIQYGIAASKGLPKVIPICGRLAKRVVTIQGIGDSGD